MYQLYFGIVKTYVEDGLANFFIIDLDSDGEL